MIRVFSILLVVSMLLAGNVKAQTGDDGCTGAVIPETIRINWQFPDGGQQYPDIKVNVQDTLQFDFQKNIHDVWRYPSNSCDATGAEQLSDGTRNDNTPYKHWFREAEDGTDAGRDWYFACGKPG
jgi:hypothetical protein